MSIAQSSTTVETLIVEFRQMYPALNGRIEKAARMVGNGQVIELSDRTYQVAGSRDQPYLVSWHPTVNEFSGRINPAPGWNCTCPDVGHTGYAPTVDFYGSSGRPICKHIVAAVMVELLASNYRPEALPQGQELDPVDMAQAAERKAQDWADQQRPTAPNHHNANLTDEERAAKLAKAQREQEAARRRLAKMDPTPHGEYNGFGGPRNGQDEYDEVARFDPALADKLRRRAAAYEAALRPDKVNRKANHNRNFNIERR